jgi:oligoribonuclease
MTGLNYNKDKIIEIATLITDEHLNPLDPDGFERVIHCSENLLNGMDEWCTAHHENVSFPHFNLFILQSGLTARVLASTNTTESVENELFEYIQRYVPVEGTGHLAGHCVYVDRDFIRSDFPRVFNWLNFRIVGRHSQECSVYEDVSTIRFLSDKWAPRLADSAPARKGRHRAMADILETITELQHYKECLWKAIGR